jgi:hypothetical protein
MNRHRTPILATIAAIAAVGALAGAALVVVPAQATPPSGVTTTMIGLGRFTSIDAKAKTDIDPGPATEFWKGPDQDQPKLRSACAAEHDRPGWDLRLAQPPRP